MTWVDPDTPDDRQVYASSRGRPWELVMSDEFNVPKRDFRPGKDHVCDDDGTCYFDIESTDGHNNITVYNLYLNPPGYETVKFFYRAAMVQSWNKFCFQGGMLEARAQFPGAVSSKSGNPDLAKGQNGKTEALRYYLKWPGIWMMGNLGRAIFSASTNRMWPFSYNRCDPDVFEPTNQRISAFDANPMGSVRPRRGDLAM